MLILPNQQEQSHCFQWLLRISVFMLCEKLKMAPLPSCNWDATFKDLSLPNQMAFYDLVGFLWLSGAFSHSGYYSQSILENGKNSRAAFLAELGNRSPWYLSAKCQSLLNPNLTYDGSPWVSDKASLAKWNFSVIHWQTQNHRAPNSPSVWIWMHK